ncbi:hypothetical protein CYR55_22380 [Chimaeribacter californicus]|uniref:Uncharacterized protein n=1 Tax=Chimaeribacter californicus TaxID=2060067 RepID=A0A2N5DTZ9_9GAMM|nr:hypothetical protein CYR55_22380 [Chimaeribacter californicus]
MALLSLGIACNNGCRAVRVFGTAAKGTLQKAAIFCRLSIYRRWRLLIFWMKDIPHLFDCAISTLDSAFCATINFMASSPERSPCCYASGISALCIQGVAEVREHLSDPGKGRVSLFFFSIPASFSLCLLILLCLISRTKPAISIAPTRSPSSRQCWRSFQLL